MNVRFRESAAIAAAFGAAFSLGLRTLVEAQSPDLLFTLFDESRALRAQPVPVTGPSPAVSTALESSATGKKYASIRPERSVLIYDCAAGSAWCSQPVFSFQSIFSEAAKIANAARPDPAGLALLWYNSAALLDPAIKGEPATFTTLASAPFQLLAIANRMDLAHFNGTKWVGAEIHFVYGLTPAPGATKAQHLMMIMEFELPAFGRNDFKNLATTWNALSTVPDTGYAAALQGALKASGFFATGQGTKLIKVVSRFNHEVMPNQWQFSQLLLDPTSPDVTFHTTFAAAPLNDQLSRDVVTDSPLFLDLWRQNLTVVSAGVSHFPITGLLMEKPFRLYSDSGTGQATPKGFCDSTRRNVLGMQQCTLCHTKESNTNFAHISNRLTSQNSELSKFLVGAGGKATLHPKLIDLYYGTPTVVWTAQVLYQTYMGAACTTPMARTMTRKFHDVARRTLFLAAIEADEADANQQIKAIHFSTLFTE